MAQRTTRRGFLGALAGAASAPYVAPASAFGQAGRPAPSDRIGLGYIGLGARGMSLLAPMLARGDCQALALCDPFRSKCDLAVKRIQDAYAQRRPDGNWRGCLATADFREVITVPDVDAVFITSPEHWHVLQSLAAVRAGKDVYVEKALGTCIAETQALVKAVKQYGRVLQVGTQLRSDARYRFACELARNGFLGKLHTIKVGDPAGYQGPPIRSETPPPDLDWELWLGPAPWRPYFPQRTANLAGWMLTYDYTIGFLSGWGQHDLDIAQWGNGTDATGPIEVEGRGLIPADGLNDTVTQWYVEYLYANDVRLIFASTDQLPFGVRFEGDRGWVFLDRSRNVTLAEPASLLAVQLAATDIHLERSSDHAGNFIQCVRTRRPPICNVDVGHHTYVVCALSDIAIRLGRKLHWDPASETFPGDPEANRMLRRPMREPWTL